MICHPLLIIALGLSLQAQDTLQYDALIYGRITSTDTTRASTTAPPVPISSVTVDLTAPDGTIRQQTGDETGTYLLSGLASGIYRLRFARAGYVPFTLNVRLAEHGSVHLDVNLDRAPPTMPTIKVVATDARRRIPANPVSTGAYRPWRIDGDRMVNSPSLDFPDVIRIVGTSTNATAGPESSAGLHTEGGATNHTSLLLDGIPVYNAVHAGDHPSAINPDIVADITSYSEPRAMTGGTLSGVVEVSTRAALPDSQHVVTSAWPTGARALAQVQFAGGSALIGARSNYARPLQRNTRERVTLRPNDVIATATVPLAGGSLTGLVTSSADAISFDADPPHVPLSARTANRLDWSSDARALTWRRDAPSGFSMDARVWQSGTSVGSYWVPVSGSALQMANQFSQAAASTNVSWTGQRSVTSVGVAIERLRGTYSVADTSRADAASLLGVRSVLQVASAFLEHSHDIGKFTATFGGRVALVNENQLLFEPRVAIAVSLLPGISISGAFARTHQYTQSLYNDESIVDATMVSLDVPVVSGNAGVPVAASTSGSLHVDWSIGALTQLTMTTYARTFYALVLPAPSGGDPFATRLFSVGSGEAYGASLGIDSKLRRLDLQGVYSMSSVSREWAGERSYKPTFAPNSSVLLSAGYAVGDNTLLRASGFMSAIRSTSPLLGTVDWDWQDLLASQRQVSGSPQYSSSTVGTGRLRPYLRIDLGVRHTLTFGSRLRASAYVNVDNVLDRHNSVGLVEDPSGTGTHTLGMMPCSLSFGLGIGF